MNPAEHGENLYLYMFWFQSITSEDLRKIQNSYFDYTRQQERMRVLIIETGDKDFVSQKEDFELIANLIFDKKYPLGINRIIL